jgi:hypothetical protein
VSLWESAEALPSQGAGSAPQGIHQGLFANGEFLGPTVRILGDPAVKCSRLGCEPGLEHW